MLTKLSSGLIIVLLSYFGAFSSSSHYALKSYAFGPGGTNSAHSTTYYAQSTLGETTNNISSSTNYKGNNSSIQAEQLNVPPAPTLSNGSGSYYNKLLVTINTGGNPSDSTYAIAVSTNNFVSTQYVQVDGTLGGSQFYQSYSAWGGASGSYIIDLLPSTTYKVKVAAMEGMFTNTEFGAYSSASTVAPSITFSVSSNSINLGNLLPGNIVTNSTLGFTFSTNAVDGGSVYVTGQNNGLHSNTVNYTIPAYTGNLSSQSQGFGIQAINAAQTSGGPFSAVAPFNGSGNNVGAETTTPQQLLNSANPISGASANGSFQAEASSTTPSASDYQEVLTFEADANF